MEKSPGNSVPRTLLILFISLMLLMAQTNRMHMHIEHTEHAELSGTATDHHIVNVHTTTLTHDIESLNHSGHHHDQHSAAIDVGPDNLNQKTKLLNPLVLILLFFGLILSLGRQISRPGYAHYIKPFTCRFYLFRPPLRAPPLI